MSRITGDSGTVRPYEHTSDPEVAVEHHPRCPEVALSPFVSLMSNCCWDEFDYASPVGVWVCRSCGDECEPIDVDCRCEDIDEGERWSAAERRWEEETGR